MQTYDKRLGITFRRLDPHEEELEVKMEHVLRQSAS